MLDPEVLHAGLPVVEWGHRGLCGAVYISFGGWPPRGHLRLCGHGGLGSNVEWEEKYLVLSPGWGVMDCHITSNVKTMGFE